MNKEIHIEEVGNAYKLQLQVWPEGAPRYQGGIPLHHGKPVVVLDTASDEVLGKAVRDLLRARIRTARSKAAAERGAT
jgi:hypothetical protein